MVCVLTISLLLNTETVTLKFGVYSAELDVVAIYYPGYRYQTDADQR